MYTCSEIRAQKGRSMVDLTENTKEIFARKWLNQKHAEILRIALRKISHGDCRVSMHAWVGQYTLHNPALCKGLYIAWFINKIYSLQIAKSCPMFCNESLEQSYQVAENFRNFFSKKSL